jgi:mannose-1-phosphate guanylyltransferase
VKAVVLVGGEGTRLRPLTYHTPKPLLPIANVPFIERQLTWLAGHGVDEVVLSLGYLPEAFQAHFASGTFGSMTVRWVIETEPLGTAGGIRFAAEGIDERVVVCNGDVLTDLDLSALVHFHDERGAEATIALTQVSDPSAFGVVPTRDDGEVVAFVEKPPPGRAPTNWINAGTYVLEPSVLQRIPSRLTVSIERETFPRMLDTPRRLFAQHSDAYWLDIGTPRKYAEAQADVLAGRMGLPPAPGAVEQAAGVWVQGHVDVDPDARLRASVLLGHGAKVGPGADVAESVVGPGATIEPGARVLRSVVLAGARVGADDKAVDVVVAPDARLECAG